MFWDLNLCLTHQPKWKRHCDWVMTSNYILDTINSFKRNGCIRLLERSGLSQYRKVRKQDNIKFKNHHFFFPFTFSAKEWRIWISGWSILNWCLLCSFLFHFFFFVFLFLKFLYSIEDENFEGTRFVGNDCKETWPWFGKGEVLIFVCGLILVILVFNLWDYFHFCSIYCATHLFDWKTKQLH